MSEKPARPAPYTETVVSHTAPSQALAEGGVGDGRELDTALSAGSCLPKLVAFSATDVRVGEPPVGYLGASKPWDTAPLGGRHRYFKCKMLQVTRSISRGGWPHTGPGTPTHPQGAPMPFSGGRVARVGGVTMRRAPSRTGGVGGRGLGAVLVIPTGGAPGLR